jgi:vacuolar protein sorting-associated protein 13A/C
LGSDAAEPEPAAKFTDEDLERFNQLIGYQEGQQSNILPGQEPPNMLHTLLDVRMRHNATKLVSQDKEDLLELSCDDLQCVLHMYPKTIRFDLKLGSYQVACPEGLLAESATKTEAVNATFTYLPSEMDLDSSGEKLDWSLAAKASPCYGKVLMRSINKVIKFFQSSKAVSRSVALDTATALQTTLDEVTRNAQQQINQALKDRPRFSIDLDLAAPKITIPTDFYPDGEHQCNLLVDLGYFSLQTELDDTPTESKEEVELYMRFRMRLTDVSAILVDGEHDWKKDYDDVAGYLIERKQQQKRDTYLPVLDKCGMLVAVQQICVPHPQYPTTRVALWLPSLGFHFSPARYHRLMEVLKVFQNSESDDDNGVRPWEPSDFEGKASVLAWKGVGHREAVWQHRHAVLTGPFLYLLDSPDAQTYKYCSSLIGKQVSVVPPESVGGVPYVLAECDAGQFNNKVVESVNALLLRFEDESIMNRWQGRITGAIYRTSVSYTTSSQ